MLPGIMQPPEEWAAYKQPRLFIRTNGVASGAAYAWTQQYQDTPGVFTDDPNGQSGTTTDLPAYMADGWRFVPDGTICEAVKHYGGWLIAWPITSCVCNDGVGSGSGGSGSGGGDGTCPCLDYQGNYCVSFPGVTNTDCSDCANAHATHIMTKPLPTECTWYGRFPACEGLYGPSSGFNFRFSYNPISNNFVLTVLFNSPIGGSGLVIDYVASATGWDCDSPLTMTKYGSSYLENEWCQNWPATITVQPCGCASYPTVTQNLDNLCVDDTTLVVNGTGFSTTASENILTMSSGTWSCTSSTATQMTITRTMAPSLGALTMIVTVNGCSSAPAVQVAAVVDCVTLVWQDTFTDANGTALTAHTPDVSPGGSGYTDINGGAGGIFRIIATNRVGETIGASVAGVRFNPGQASARASIDFVYKSGADFYFTLSPRDGSPIVVEVADNGGSENITIFDTAGNTSSAALGLVNGTTYTLTVENTPTQILATCNAISVTRTTSEAYGDTDWEMTAEGLANDDVIVDDLEVTPWA